MYPYKFKKFNTHVHCSQWTYCSNGYKFSKARTSPRVLFAQNGATTSSFTGQAFLEDTHKNFSLKFSSELIYLNAVLMLIETCTLYSIEMKIIRISYTIVVDDLLNNLRTVLCYFLILFSNSCYSYCFG